MYMLQKYNIKLLSPWNGFCCKQNNIAGDENIPTRNGPFGALNSTSGSGDKQRWLSV